jgi:RNA polymerase II C-terminal domain phosphatase-like 3/4
MASDSEPGPTSPISSVDSDLARALDDDDYDDDSEQQEDAEPVGNGQESVELDEYDADQQEALAAAEQYLTDEDEADVATAAPEELPAKRRKLNSGDTSPKAADTCEHPGFLGGMCVKCGMHKPGEEDQEPHEQGAPPQPGQRGSAAGGGGSGSGLLTLKHMSRHHIELSASEARRIQQAAASRLLAARKLVLVLDLDHTLLNSTRCAPAPAAVHLHRTTFSSISAHACCRMKSFLSA